MLNTTGAAPRLDSTPLVVGEQTTGCDNTVVSTAPCHPGSLFTNAGSGHTSSLSEQQREDPSSAPARELPVGLNAPIEECPGEFAAEAGSAPVSLHAGTSPRRASQPTASRDAGARDAGARDAGPGPASTVVAGRFEQAFANLVGARNFESLLKSRIECTYQGGRLRVEAAHPFVLQLLQSRFRGPLREAAEAVGCEPPEPRLSPRPAATPGATPSDGSRPTHPPAPPGTAAFSHALVPDATSGVGHPSAGLASGNTPSASPATARDRSPSAPSATGAAGSHAQGAVAVSRRFGRLDDFVAGPHAA
ncbi:MAG: hypothetical protein ACKOFW_21160, partial [Planctomycetaceae bacterium]